MITRIAFTIALARAYLLGIAEFRLSCTTGHDDWRVADAYDRGREFAHRVTQRRWDECY